MSDINPLRTATAPEVALWSPRIPQNVGAIGRLCAATMTPLHIVRPIPFSLDERSLRRAGMDYWEDLTLSVHDRFEDFLAERDPFRFRLLTTRGEADLFEADFGPAPILLFGNEPHGVSDDIRAAVPREHHIRIPMAQPKARSLNLAMSVAIVLYEVLGRSRRA